MKKPVDYPLGAVSRLTGLSEHVLRAWERRHSAVRPRRTPGGTRRYSEADVERLHLLASLVEAGYPIGQVADLSADELRARLPRREHGAHAALGAALLAVERLDAAEAERLISLQLAALGPARFACEFALPLLEEIGERWAKSRLCVASEHLASAILRSLLGSSLRVTPAAFQAPRVVFASPAGERHELGVLIAALVAQGAGGNAIYLGPDLPVDELVRAVETVEAAALALGITVSTSSELRKLAKRLRARLPDQVELWMGGAAVRQFRPPPGVQVFSDLDHLERKIALLGEKR
jgi:DNA-binding transcriptional MerR regulator/methylmalonyl-CoA mutase cobalamin-binding subunit